MRLARVAIFSLLMGCQFIGYESTSSIEERDGQIVPDNFDASAEDGSVMDARATRDATTLDSNASAADATMSLADASDSSACVPNACGGCSTLAFAVDARCGKCGLGKYTCDGTDAVVCTGADTLPMASSGTYLLDNWDDGNDITATGEGYSFAYSDGTAGTLDPKDGFRIKPVLGGAAGTKYAAHLKGSGFTEYGAGMIIWPNAQECTFDASAERGISFYVKGSATGDVLMSIATPQTLDPALCGNGCRDFHGASFTLTNEWAHPIIQLRNLKQGGWGQPVAFDPSQILYIQFSFNKNVTFDLYVDELTLF